MAVNMKPKAMKPVSKPMPAADAKPVFKAKPMESVGAHVSKPRVIDSMKPVTFRAHPDDKLEWAMYALKQRISVQDLITLAIREYVDRHPVVD